MTGARSLLVTGCGGFVGGGVVHEGRVPLELHAVSRGKPLLHRKGLVWHTLDLLDTDEVERLFREVSPDAVIHAAARADIDFCEANKDIAHDINVGVTQRLTDLCRDRGARMIFVSTDTVFDGKKGNYVEEDPPGPLNWYAETKLAAERLVAGMPGGWVVVRTSLVVGLPVLGAGNSFLSRMLCALEAGKELGVPDNEIRSPIDVVTLARALIELAGNEYVGYLHLAGNDILNRFEMVQRIAAKLGFPSKLVVARNPEHIPGRAARPLDVSLCNEKARSILETPMLDLVAGLDLALSAKKGIVL
jgi:dTDP-4-dehydrorhamnose reductase